MVNVLSDGNTYNVRFLSSSILIKPKYYSNTSAADLNYLFWINMFIK